MKWVSMLCLSVVLVAGCQNPPASRLNSPPQGQTAHRSPMQKPFASMADNAVLQDMSVADIHFAGTSAQLSGLGKVRLEKIVDVLKTYGGDVRYNAQVRDDVLVQARRQRIEDFLASAGVNMDKVTVKVEMPASDGMAAAEAIKAQQAPTASCGGDAGASAGAGILPALPGAGGGNK